MALTAVGGDPSRLERVTAQLAEELASGRWPVGSKIPGELALCEQLQVSRPVVREAIRGLTRLGLLEPRQGAGTFVLSLTNPAALLSGVRRADVRQIFEVQMAYDVQAAGLAAERHGAPDLQRLRELLKQRDAAEDDRDDPARFADADADFHLAVVKASHNPLLIELYRFFLDHLRNGLLHVHADRDLPTCGHQPHAEIVEAIAARDAARARDAAYQVVALSLVPLAEHSSPAVALPQPPIGSNQAS